MANIRTDVHNVVSVRVERRSFSDFVTMEIIATTADGSSVTLQAYSAEPLVIVDEQAYLAGVSA